MEYREVYRLLGRAIRDRRRLDGYSQMGAAERLGYNSQYLSRIERGQTNLRLAQLVHICATFEWRLEELLSTELLDAIQATIGAEDEAAEPVA